MKTIDHPTMPTRSVLGEASSRMQPTHPGGDDELLRLCEQFHALHPQMPPGANENPADGDAAREAVDRWHHLVETIRRAPATTLSGLQAKASTYLPVHQRLTGDDAHDFATLVELGMARSLVLDILRMQG